MIGPNQVRKQVDTYVCRHTQVLLVVCVVLRSFVCCWR